MGHVRLIGVAEFGGEVCQARPSCGDVVSQLPHLPEPQDAPECLRPVANGGVAAATELSFAHTERGSQRPNTNPWLSSQPRDRCFDEAVSGGSERETGSHRAFHGCQFRRKRLMISEPLREIACLVPPQVFERGFAIEKLVRGYSEDRGRHTWAEADTDDS